MLLALGAAGLLGVPLALGGRDALGGLLGDEEGRGVREGVEEGLLAKLALAVRLRVVLQLGL